MSEDIIVPEALKKLGSCSACRRARARCEREESPGGTPQRCVRCTARDDICRYSTYRAGRKRGSRNKRPISKSHMENLSDQLGVISHTSGMEPLAPTGSSSFALSLPTSFTALSGQDSSINTNPLRYIQELDSDGRTAVLGPEASNDYFGLPNTILDNGPDMDPVILGLVTLAEATRLFDFGRAHLGYLKFALDQEWYTFERIRSRSCLLFNAILARAAGLSEDGGAICTRLSAHGRRMVLLIFNGHFRSIEIVLALLIMLIWSPASESESDDPTARLLSLMLDMALNLQMDRVIGFPGSTETPHRGVLDPRQVMTIDAMDIGTMSDMDVSRHLRSRQRIFFNVFVHGPGINMVRGRPCSLPIGPLLASCDEWHLDPAAIPTDYHVVGVVVLIRDKEALLETIRPLGLGGGTVEIDNMVKVLVEDYFNSWMTKWRDPLLAVGADPTTMVAVLEQVASNHRLSTYTDLIAQREKQAFPTNILVSAAVDAAIAVLNVPLRYEAFMATASNVVHGFVAFASAFVLKCKSSGAEMSPAAQALIPWLPDAALDLLERVSVTPAHRNGVGLYYVKQVRAHFFGNADQKRPSRSSTSGGLSGSMEQSGKSTGRLHPSASSTVYPSAESSRATSAHLSNQIRSGLPPAEQQTAPAPASAQPSRRVTEVDWLEWINQVGLTQFA